MNLKIFRPTKKKLLHTGLVSLPFILFIIFMFQPIFKNIYSGAFDINLPRVEKIGSTKITTIDSDTSWSERMNNTMIALTAILSSIVILFFYFLFSVREHYSEKKEKTDNANNVEK